jgi:phage baseplate assembly protein gpV
LLSSSSYATFVAALLALAQTFSAPVASTRVPFTSPVGQDSAQNWKIFRASSNGEDIATATQADTLRNSETVSSANTAVTTSIAAVSAQKVALYSMTARCSAGTASLTVKNGVGGTTIWTTAATDVTTAAKQFTFSTPLASATGNGMDIVLSTCGASNTGTLDVQASQF